MGQTNRHEAEIETREWEGIWSRRDGMKGAKFRRLVNKLPRGVSAERTAEIYYDPPVGSRLAWKPTIFTLNHKSCTPDPTKV